MTAGPFVADEVFKRIWPKWRDWLRGRFSETARRKAEVLIVVAGLFYACFAAFQGERVAREQAEHDLKQATQKLLDVSPAGQEQALKRMQEDLDQARNAERERRKKDWRPLTDEEAKKWVTELAPYKNADFLVHIFFSDDHSSEFRDSLSQVFQKIGWQVASMNAFNGIGLQLIGRENDPAVPVLNSLFESIGHKPSRSATNERYILIRVGKKPTSAEDGAR